MGEKFSAFVERKEDSNRKNATKLGLRNLCCWIKSFLGYGAVDCLAINLATRYIKTQAVIKCRPLEEKKRKCNREFEAEKKKVHGISKPEYKMHDA